MNNVFQPAPFIRIVLVIVAVLCHPGAPAAFAGTVWDGGGNATTSINTATNWDGDVVNSLNGTTAATFGTGGSTANINVNASFTGITINRDAPFTISDGAGNLTVGADGITVTLPTTTSRTHTISESSVILGANQTWSVTNNTGAAQLDVTGIVSGASFGITKNGTGTLRLTGASTFGGGLTVNEGAVLVQTSASALGGSGTGVVNLGSTSAGTNNVTLSLGQSLIFNNPITVQSGNSGTVTINNFGFYNATLAGTITLNKGLTLTNTDNSSPYAALTVGGKITGASGLTLAASNAAGLITLSNAANDYTGTTTVSSGTLNLTGALGNTATTVAGGASISGEGSIGSDGNLTFSGGSFLRVDGTTAGALSVGGDLDLGATTNVILDGVPAATGIGTGIRLLNYSGLLSGSAANLSLQNAANYRNASFSTATANQVNLSIDTKSLTWSGATAAWDINSSANWDGGTENFFQGDAVTFTDAGTTKAVTLDVAVMPASVTFSNSSGNDYSLAGTGAIGGASGITKNGSGTVTLSNNNTYTGGTTISGGKLVAAAANALGTGLVANAATLDLTAGGVTYTGLSTALSGAGIVNVTLGTGSGSTILNGDYSSYTGTWNIGIGAAAGAGKVQMNGADNTAATVNVLTNGTIYVTGSVTKNASLVLNGGDTGESLGQLRLDSGATWAGPITLAGNVTGSGDGTIGGSTGTGTISGNISESAGSRTLVKVGVGTTILSGTNTYTGGTTISAGTLRLGGVGALGNGTLNTSGVTVNGSSIFDLGGITTTASVPLTLNSSAGGFDVGSFYNSGATATFAGAVTLSANTRVGAGNINLTGAITGNSKNLLRDGLGTLDLANNGVVTLAVLQGNRGTIQVDAGTTLNVTSMEIGTGTNVGASLIMNGGNLTSSGISRFGQGAGSASGTLILNSGTLTVPALTKGSLTFNVNFNGGTLKASGNNASFLASATLAKVQAGGAVVDDGGFAITIGQALTHDTALVGTADGGLTKSGAGTLTLTGNNTYNGTTTVSAGTLLVSGGGRINTSSGISVATGATLTNDSGVAITPALMLAEAAALGGIGSFGPVAMILVADLSGGMFTPVALSTSLVKEGALGFTLTNVTDGSYALFGGTAPTGSFTSVSIGGSPLADQGGGVFSAEIGGIDYTFTDGTNILLVAIPEPGTWALVGIGLTFLLHRRRPTNGC